MSASAKNRLPFALGLGLVLILADLAALPLLPGFTSPAEARIGRPLTPLSGAGVARRTTRRVITRSAIYVASLPAACARVTVNGTTVWRCGGTYYQAYNGRYVVVYVK
ncbi:hypothetical protein [Taklimakanibacter deserti]|uniref:hypothetical protein n=1 Tax=Taklimakanibacter deserti TaxID=2267839 RepID=UPI0034D4D46A